MELLLDLVVLPRDGLVEDPLLDSLLRRMVGDMPLNSLWVDSSTSANVVDDGEHHGQSWFLVSQPCRLSLREHEARSVDSVHGLTS